MGNTYSIPLLLLLLKCCHLNATNPQKLDFSSTVTVQKHGMLRDSSIHQNQQRLLWHLSGGRSSVLAGREQDEMWICASGTCFALCLHRRLSLRAEPGARKHKDLKAGELHNNEPEKTPTLGASHTDPSDSLTTTPFPSKPTIPIITTLTVNIVLPTVIPV